MGPFRYILVAILAVSFFAGSNLCALANLFPAQFADCCETVRADACDLSGVAGESEEAPQSHESCNSCLTLTNGFCRTHLEPVSATVPDRQPDERLTAILQLVMKTESAAPLPVPEDLSPPGPALWHFVSRTALPVRGPSAV